MIARLAAALLLAIVCAACSNPLARRGGINFQTPAYTTTPGAASTLPATSQSQSPTPSGAVQTAGADWKKYADAALGVTFAYPPNWQEKSPGSFAGSGGYARVELRASDGASTGAICQAEANHDKPQTYGAFPEIRDISQGNAPGCLILPSSDQSALRRGEALYLLWLPASVRKDTLWVLHADSQHIIALVKSLSLIAPAASASHCDFQVKTLKVSTYQQAGLRIDEFPVASGTNCSPYQEAVGFNQVASQGAPAAAAAQVVQGQFAYARIARLNTRLAPFGYQVQTYVQSPQTLFRVVKAGKVLRSNIFWIGQLTVNTSGTDFILPIVDSYNSLTLIVRADGVHTVENWDLLLFDNVFPVFVGNDAISLEYDYQRIPRQSNDPALLQVKKNGQLIDTLSIDGTSPTRGPVRGLTAWNGHWILELPDYVIQDGQSLNEQLGYSDSFTWRLLGEKPFYFYQKSGQIHTSYNDQTLPLTYDAVIHAPQVSTALLLEMKAYSDGLLFYARRGDTWYYVTLRTETP